ncbi:conserved hypothetical protein [Uncinocarpus reesii 1704]|uniref:Kelch repeat protein n=1 Tax=Uncinocarpus reesii (strain UAMH 1704) TaxID=336963 RepID=C4JEW7_UNCRE|nr:uncharacterized protein UREG_00867 [Uncinocarpus reesii 1704]EEP76020.1 conserved hypothetical protein [Uncinocarpus reesii 1704]
MTKLSSLLLPLFIGVHSIIAALVDLSEGFCRSYKFGSNIANNVLYLNGLDGGLIPADGDASTNLASIDDYLVQLDLTRKFSVDVGSYYRMSLIDPAIPKLKDQALWSSQDNSTLYCYGGRGVSNTSADNGIWTYKTAEKTWQLQQASVRPVRLVKGAYVNAPRIQSAYWIGGYQSNDTSLAIGSELIFAKGMIQLNTTTGELKELDSPFPGVQQGALVYVPVGELGILVFMGGEVPSVTSEVGAKINYTPNSWNYVQVYDIASGKWFNQTTSGLAIEQRTEFCAVVLHDESSSSYQIYVLGGGTFSSTKALSDVSYLSIPSFKWYQAASLDEPRMTLTCEAYGRQIFGIGGRKARYDDARAGCYTMPAFLYDTKVESIVTTFDPALVDYSIPSATKKDIEDSPFPSTWADPDLESLFPPNATSSNTLLPTPFNYNSKNEIPVGAIVGGVIGGVAADGGTPESSVGQQSKDRKDLKMVTIPNLNFQ